MSVTPEEVLHIARLAELEVAADALPTLATQMSTILEYVAQLSRLPTGETVRPFLAGPDAIRLRPDEVRPWPLAFGPKDLAPAFRDGFFVVPRLEAFDDGGGEEGEGEGAAPA
jgi:aspartyl-tRNA(Asn)/glutamyl-tRNA(Gln) amidotransferase subunit C